MSTTPRLDIVPFPEHYAYVLVESGESKEIFYLPVTAGYVGFIERIACDWFEGTDPPDTRSILELVIDGFTRKFEYQIDINKPYVLDPPIVARNYIRWRVTNNDTKSHYFGILTDGYMAKPK